MRTEEQAEQAPSTRPPGQPACRMLSQCVLFLGKERRRQRIDNRLAGAVAQSEKQQLPMYRHQ